MRAAEEWGEEFQDEWYFGYDDTRKKLQGIIRQIQADVFREVVVMIEDKHKLQHPYCPHRACDEFGLKPDEVEKHAKVVGVDIESNSA